MIRPMLRKSILALTAMSTVAIPSASEARHHHRYDNSYDGPEKATSSRATTSSRVTIRSRHTATATAIMAAAMVTAGIAAAARPERLSVPVPAPCSAVRWLAEAATTIGIAELPGPSSARPRLVGGRRRWQVNLLSVGPSWNEGPGGSVRPCFFFRVGRIPLPQFLLARSAFGQSRRRLGGSMMKVA